MSYSRQHMKKLILILTLAAFACSPLMQTQAQAASRTETKTVKHHKKDGGKHAKKHHKKKTPAAG